MDDRLSQRRRRKVPKFLKRVVKIIFIKKTGNEASIVENFNQELLHLVFYFMLVVLLMESPSLCNVSDVVVAPPGWLLINILQLLLLWIQIQSTSFSR